MRALRSVLGGHPISADPFDHPDDPDATAVVAAREHRDGWLNGYRGVLGFVCMLILAPVIAGIGRL